MSLKQTIIEPAALRLRHSRLRLSILKQLLSFDNFLHRWISFFAFENNLHPKHRLTQYHQFFLDNIGPSDNVLDVGCGLGILARDIAQQANKVVGIDINKQYLATAKEKYNCANLIYIHGDATTYKFKETFDVLILSNTLEHIKDRTNFLKKLKPHARKFLIRVPMINRDWLVLLKKELGIEHRLDPTHFTEYTEKSFKKELTAAGLSIKNLSVRFGEIYCVAHASATNIPQYSN